MIRECLQMSKGLLVVSDATMNPCRGFGACGRTEADAEKDGLHQTIKMLQRELGEQSAALSQVSYCFYLPQDRGPNPHRATIFPGGSRLILKYDELIPMMESVSTNCLGRGGAGIDSGFVCIPSGISLEMVLW